MEEVLHTICTRSAPLIGTHFGIVTDIETGPNGNLFVVSRDKGAIHEISRR